MTPEHFEGERVIGSAENDDCENEEENAIERTGKLMEREEPFVDIDEKRDGTGRAHGGTDGDEEEADTKRDEDGEPERRRGHKERGQHAELQGGVIRNHEPRR